MIGSTPGQTRAGPRRLPSPEGLPGGKTVVVVVVGNRTVALGSIPVGETRVVVSNSGEAVVAVGSTLGTGEIVEEDVRVVGPTASAVGAESIPEVEQASGAVAVAAGRLDTAAAVVGAVVDEIARTRAVGQLPAPVHPIVGLRAVPGGNQTLALERVARSAAASGPEG